MALYYIVGVPGSGKTALAVDYLLSNSTNKKYDYIYNNINQFNNALVENCYSIDWNSFYDSINELYCFYHSSKDKKTDDELNEFAKELKLYKALIVIDEAHMYFDVEDKCLIWWLSYHRHIHQDIFLITQNLSLVNSKYKPFAEIFYKAVPSLLRVFPTILKYRCYSSSKMYKADMYATKKINTKTNNIFKYYKSGNNEKRTPVILKFAVVFLILISVAIGVFYTLTYSLGSNNKKITHQQTIKPQLFQPIEQPIKPKKTYPLNEYIEDLTDEYLLINFYCVSEICYVDDKKFPYSELQKLINSTNSFLLKYYKKHKLNVYDGYILSSAKFQKILGAFKYEKDTNFIYSNP